MTGIWHVTRQLLMHRLAYQQTLITPALGSEEPEFNSYSFDAFWVIHRLKYQIQAYLCNFCWQVFCGISCSIYTGSLTMNWFWKWKIECCYHSCTFSFDLPNSCRRCSVNGTLFSYFSFWEICETNSFVPWSSHHTSSQWLQFDRRIKFSYM